MYDICPLGIDPGPWTRSDRAPHKLTVYIGHTIRVPAPYTVYKPGNFVYCLYLSVFGTETIIYDNGSIDISDTF